MSCVLEYIQYVCVVGTFGSGGQTKYEFRLKVSQNFLISFCCCVVSFVDYYVVKIIVIECIKIECNTLNASANYIALIVLNAICKLTDSCFRPQRFECIICLIYKLHSMSNEKRSTANSFCIHYRRDGLPCSRCLV